MSQKWRVLALIAIMSTVAIGAVAIAIGMLYDTAVDVERQRLAVSAQREARWLESMMRFELGDLRRDRREAERASLIQFLDAHRRYQVFGATRETVLARRDGDQIAFLMRHGVGKLEANDRLPFDGERAQPMYRALQGLSGTMIGLDHEGIRVVAAYEPVEELDLGIVAKVDLAEVRAPFIRAGLLVAAISIGLVAVGAWLLHGQRGAVREAPSRRQGMEVALAGIDVRSVAAESRQSDDAIARGDAAHPIRNRLDGAGELEARHEGAFRCGGVESQAGGKIGEVEAGGPHGNAGVPRRRGPEFLRFPSHAAQRAGFVDPPDIPRRHRFLRAAQSGDRRALR